MVLHLLSIQSGHQDEGKILLIGICNVAKLTISCLVDTSRASNEAWVSRQDLQDLYQRLLIMDLEFALDKKVEQDL